MKELAFAAAVVALAGAACAADYPVQRPSSAPLPNLPPLVWDWSGVYIGANAGGGWSDMNWNFPVTQFFGFAGNAFETRPKGGLVGGQIGINKQIGPWLFGLPWVFGIEFTGDSADLKETVLGPVAIFPQDAWTTAPGLNREPKLCAPVRAFRKAVAVLRQAHVSLRKSSRLFGAAV